MSYDFNRPISKLLQEAIRQLELSLGRKQLKSLNDLKVSVVVNFDQNLVFERLSIKSSTELYTNQL
jgi:predicted alpha/beta-fold hydrolase